MKGIVAGTIGEHVGNGLDLVGRFLSGQRDAAKQSAFIDHLTTQYDAPEAMLRGVMELAAVIATAEELQSKFKQRLDTMGYVLEQNVIVQPGDVYRRARELGFAPDDVIDLDNPNLQLPTPPEDA